MGPQPLVSVIVPIYNGEEYISDCLRSIYEQTYSPIEVIVVDDGSTDHSLDIIERFPGEKKIIRQEHGDVARARNTGVIHASGKFIAFLDQDDMWLPKKLERQIDIFKKEDSIDLVFSDLIKLYPSGRRHHAIDKHRIALSLKDDRLFAILVQKNVIMPSTVMVRMGSFLKAECFDESFKTCGDYEMWLRMASLGMKFRYLPEPLTMYRCYDGNTSKAADVMHHDRLRAIKKIFGSPMLTQEQRSLERRGLASAFIIGAHSFYSIGNYDAYLVNARKAISYDWRVIDFKFLTRYLRSWIFIKCR